MMKFLDTKKRRSLSGKYSFYIFSIIFLNVIFKNSIATTYYVSNTGKDISSGTSSGEAFATISKINNLTLNPGDSVLFEAGGIWRETLYISYSGSEDNWIYYGRYGEGKNPAIYASNTATWTATGTPNVWQATGLTVYSVYSDAPSGRQGRIFFVKNDSATWGLWRSNAALEDLDQEYEYTANAGSDIHYLYSQNDPNSYYDAIEVTQRSFCMTLDGTNNINYIIINGIDLKYSREANFRGGYPVPQGHHLVIRNCSIQYVGVPGSSHAYGIETMHSDLLIENCFITDAGRRAISMNWYDLSSGHNNRRCENVIIRNNTFKRGWHTTGLDLALNETNDFDTVQGVYYYNNIHDDSELSDAGGYITGGSPRLTSNQIFTYAVSNNSANGIYIVNNVFIHPTARGLNINHADSIFVWNNTFFGHNKTLEFKNPDGQVSIQDNGVILDARNNLLHDNFTGGEWEYGIHAFNVQPTISKRDFNFFSYDMAGRANSRIATIFDGTSHSYPGRNNIGMNSIRSNFGFELNSPYPNYPYFIDANNFDLHLSPNSDAVDAGTPVQIIVTDPFGINDTIGKYDINGVVRNPITPSIGAYEYIDPDPTKAEILDFQLPQQAGDANIDTIENTVTIQVEYGTDVSSLSPTILVSPNATIEPASGVSRDFTAAQEYTVTSKSGNEQVWSVAVTFNHPPEIRFEYDTSIYLGLAHFIDASSSFDLDLDTLIYEWEIPNNFVSPSLSDDTLYFLPLHNSNEGIYTITLKLGDGKNNSTENLLIEVNRYNTQANELEVTYLQANEYEEGNIPENTIDNDTLTRWSAAGNLQWITYGFQQEVYLSHFEIDFHLSEERVSYFEIHASIDNQNWSIIHENDSSFGINHGYQTFTVSDNQINDQYRYVRFIGHANSQNYWNSINEFKTYGIYSVNCDTVDIVITSDVIADTNSLSLGSIDITVSGGEQPYSYIWDDDNKLEDRNELLTGDYQLTVIDANNCESEITINIPNIIYDICEDTEINIDASVIPDTNSLSLGSIDITVSGGEQPYSYIWDDDNKLEDRNEVLTGDYQLTVIDANNCESEITINIPNIIYDICEDTEINIDAMVIPDTNNLSLGSIDITVSGGKEPYTFSWADESNLEDRVNIVSGYYILTVQDQNKCTNSKNIVVPNVTIVQCESNLIHIKGEIMPDTNNLGKGSINLTVSGGQYPYSFKWNDGYLQKDRVGIFSGEYSVTVSDQDGCNGSSGYNVPNINIDPCDGISIQVDTYLLPDTNNTGVGEISLVVSGGDSPYIYEWDDGNNQKERTGLHSDNYSVTVTDANGCKETKNFELSNIEIDICENYTILIDYFAIADTNNQGIGAIELNISGGNEPYIYEWADGNDKKNRTGLFAGNYNITITDSNNCEEQESITIINEIRVALSDYYVKNKVKTYPNPVSDYLFVEFDGDANIKIYNANGTILLSDYYTNNLATIECDFGKGIYTLKIISKKKVYIRKIVVK